VRIDSIRAFVPYWILALACVVVGVFMPVGWYATIPIRPELPPPPIRGSTLLQLAFILDGVAFAWVALARWRFTRRPAIDGATFGTGANTAERGESRAALLLLAGITLLALVLRLINVGSDLWLDEIAPVMDYLPLSPLQVIGSYLSSNNHLLSTLLMQLSVALLGQQELAIRLPSVLFGAATIPALYWVARFVLSRRGSLGAALLLAVSYHHIFFSQNARGYVEYVFFSLVGAGLLVQALRDDRGRTWVLYIAVMFLNLAAHLESAFVLAAHGLIGGVTVLIVWRQGGNAWPLVRRLACVFVIIGLLGFQLYATALPAAYVLLHSVYADATAGYAPLSLEFLQEMVRGVSAGFGAGLLLAALPFLAFAAGGFVLFLRRGWAVAAGLALPPALMAADLLFSGLPFSPRFFLLGLPLAIISVVVALEFLVDWVAGTLKRSPRFAPRLATGSVLVVSLLSLASLPGYYTTPKQPYRGSIQYVEAMRQPGDVVVVIHLAERGYEYYGAQVSTQADPNYVYVRSVAALDSVLAAHTGQNVYLVTTFPRLLKLYSPELDARINSGWAITRTFRGTIGDGDISVWRPTTTTGGKLANGS